LQLLQETEHFFRWREEKVAKIVPLGYHDIAKAAVVLGGLSFLLRGVHNCTDTQTSAGNQGSVPAIEIQINLDGVAEIAKPQVDAHNVNTKPRRR